MSIRNPFLFYDSGVLGAGVADVTISSIPAIDGASIRIEALARGVRAATTDNLYMEYNGDTTATNYVWQFVRGFEGAVSAAVYDEQGIASIPAASATAGLYAGIDILMSQYAGTAHAKTAVSTSISNRAFTSARRVLLIGLQWETADAINAIKLYPPNGNFASGSRIKLWIEY
jgi:hypothetical protein